LSVRLDGYSTDFLAILWDNDLICFLTELNMFEDGVFPEERIDSSLGLMDIVLSLASSISRGEQAAFAMRGTVMLRNE
jgi:hypothetical protein